MVRWPTCLELLQAAYVARSANLVIFNSALAALPWHQGLQLLGEASKHCQADIISRNSVMHGAPWRICLLLLAFSFSVVSLNTACAAVEWYRALALARGQAMDIVTYNTCLASCIWGRALVLSEQLVMKGLQATMVTSTALMASLKLWQRCLALLATVELCTATLNAAVAGVGASGEWTRSLSIHRLGGELQRDVVTFGSTITACDCAERWQPALALHASLRGQRLQENVVTLSAAGSACAHGARWHEALALLQQALLCQVRLNLAVWNSMMSACGACARWREVLQLRPGASGTMTTCNTVLAAVPRWRLATDLLRDAVQGRLRADALSCEALVRAVWAAGAWLQLMKLLALTESCAW